MRVKKRNVVALAGEKERHRITGRQEKQLIHTCTHPNEIPISYNKETNYRVSVISTKGKVNTLFDNRPHADIEIFGDKFHSLLDSGANVCVLGKGSEAYLERWRPKKIPLNAKITTADDSKVAISYYIIVPVVYKDKVKFIKFLVAPEINKTCILGMNFWNEFGLQIVSLDLITLEQAKEATRLCDLTKEQRNKLAKLLTTFDFAEENAQIGKTSIFEHVIDVQGHPPIIQKMYPIAVNKETEVNKELDRLEKLGVIERTIDNTWLSPIIPVVKKDGSIRLVLDARKLNAATAKYTNGPQSANRILSRLQETKYLTTIDIKDGYYNIVIEENSRNFTAFAVSGRGTYRFVRMANGLCNAANSFCHAMQLVVGYDLETNVMVYMDDIIIMADTFEKHLELITEVMRRLNNAGFKANLEKSQFCRKEVEFLGLIITQNGIGPNMSKLEAIKNYPAPRTLTQTRRFMGMLNWQSRFIDNFATRTAPITDTLKNTKAPFVWTKEANAAFNDIKERLTSVDFLAMPDYSLPFRLHTDSSNVGAGAVLTQIQNNEERIIGYFSSKYKPAQTRYSTTEKEALALILALEFFKTYIDGSSVTCIVDHAALIWLNTFKHKTERLLRWSIRLSMYPIEIIHKKGKEHCMPDALSRIHEVNAVDFDSFVSSKDKTYMDLVNEYINKATEDADDKFVFKNDTLYKRIKRRDKIYYRIYVPKDRVIDALRECHDAPTSAHGGVFKTIHKLKQHYHFPDMEKIVKKYVKHCDVCQTTKQANYNLTPEMGKPRIPSRPFGIIAVDFIGPVTRSTKQNKWILTIVDTFTKYTVIHPCREATAKVAADVIENDIVYTFGAPQVIISDNGSQFRSKIFTDMVSRHNIDLWFTPAYHSQANPSEIVNKSIGNAIRATVKEYDQKHWDRDIKKIQIALNTARHSVTLVTPFEIVFNMKYHATGEHKTRSIDTDDVDILNLRSSISKRLEENYKRMKIRYDEKALNTKYSVGETVLHRNTKLSSKINDYAAKLDDRYVKAIVKEKMGTSTYLLMNDKGKEIGKFSSKDMKKYHDSDSQLNLQLDSLDFLYK